MQRYFSDKKEKNKLLIKNEDLIHIRKVMRMNNGDKIEVIYDNILYLCIISDINDIYVTIDSISDSNNELNKKITIAFPLLKEEKIDLILQKCTEIGVNSFIPINMERCLVKLNAKEEKKLERWSKIIKEAAEQSKRNIIPVISNVISINELGKLDYDLKLICSLHEDSINLKKVLQNTTKCDKIIIVSGPEGGFSNNEEEILIKNGYKRISLGKTVKRCESAPIYVSSALSYEFMEE